MSLYGGDSVLQLAHRYVDLLQSHANSEVDKFDKWLLGDKTTFTIFSKCNQNIDLTFNQAQLKYPSALNILMFYSTKI